MDADDRDDRSQDECSGTCGDWSICPQGGFCRDLMQGRRGGRLSEVRRVFWDRTKKQKGWMVTVVQDHNHDLADMRT